VGGGPAPAPAAGLAPAGNRAKPGLVQRYFEGAVVFENTHGCLWLL